MRLSRLHWCDGFGGGSQGAPDITRPLPCRALVSTTRAARGSTAQCYSSRYAIAARGASSSPKREEGLWATPGSHSMWDGDLLKKYVSPQRWLMHCPLFCMSLSTGPPIWRPNGIGFLIGFSFHLMFVRITNWSDLVNSSCTASVVCIHHTPCLHPNPFILLRQELACVRHPVCCPCYLF